MDDTDRLFWDEVNDLMVDRGFNFVEAFREVSSIWSKRKREAYEEKIQKVYDDYKGR